MLTVACGCAEQENEKDLSGPRPEEGGSSSVPADVRRKWEEARKSLVFKVGASTARVSTLRLLLVLASPCLTRLRVLGGVSRQSVERIEEAVNFIFLDLPRLEAPVRVCEGGVKKGMHLGTA